MRVTVKFAMDPAPNAPAACRHRGARRFPGFAGAGLLLVAMLIGVTGALAQQDEKPKIPGLDKIISANQHLMFTGKVKAVDLDRSTISISSVEGSDTEIFPVKRNTKLLTSDGFRKKIESLSPGTQVIVYYDQRADRRTVTHIDLYTSETKKKEPQS